ncbi:MAG: hypothetical protein RLY86_3117 [Pseudomonadota bacterium]
MGERIDLSGYRLIFSEEFDNLHLTGPGGGLWKTEGYWGSRTLPGNGERQLYVDAGYNNLGIDPFRVENGVLTIRAEPMAPELKAKSGSLAYTSGMITSETSFSMQYGYFEIRAQMPAGKGLWPAFWMLALDGQWPPELDVVEILGHEPDKLYGTVHWKDAAGRQQKVNAANVKGLIDSADGFHTYGVDWQADRITWFVDGRKVGETANVIHTQPMYLIANLAVGGHWPGNPNPATPFPADMRIDWIRAWQRPPDHPILALPTTWAPIGREAFVEIGAAGARTVWDWRHNLADGQVKAALGGTWARYLAGNDADNYIAGSYAPYNELMGGRGRDTLFGGPGSDVFIIRDGDGNDIILDLSNRPGNTDKIRLEGFHFRHADDVLAWARADGADTIIRLDADQALLLRDVSPGDLRPEMFVFVGPVAPPPDAVPLPNSGKVGPGGGNGWVADGQVAPAAPPGSPVAAGGNGESFVSDPGATGWMDLPDSAQIPGFAPVWAGEADPVLGSGPSRLEDDPAEITLYEPPPLPIDSGTGGMAANTSPPATSVDTAMIPVAPGPSLLHLPSVPDPYWQADLSARVWHNTGFLAESYMY